MFWGGYYRQKKSKNSETSVSIVKVHPRSSASATAPPPAECEVPDGIVYYPEIVEELSRKYPQRDIEWSLQLLNYTSLIRKGHMSGFENSRCILLTGNSTTMALAFHPSIKQNGDVPLSTTLDYITNKLWFTVGSKRYMSRLEKRVESFASPRDEA